MKDPLLSEVTYLIAQNNLTDLAKWTDAVPGASTNWTSVSDTARRKLPNVMKTGKKNPNEVSSYVSFNNQTTQYVCILPMNSQNKSAYDANTQFPACAPFQRSWDEATITKMGYTLVFGSDYANRIAGTDASMYGRPVKSEKIEVYINDIYRTAYMIHTKTVEDWHKVKLRRYQLNPKGNIYICLTYAKLICTPIYNIKIWRM